MAIGVLCTAVPLISAANAVQAATTPPARSQQLDIGGFPTWYQDANGVRVQGINPESSGGDHDSGMESVHANGVQHLLNHRVLRIRVGQRQGRRARSVVAQGEIVLPTKVHVVALGHVAVVEPHA